jgi:hypothetical protein
MKFATYCSVGFNYRSRRPTFKPQKTEEAIGSDEGATSQPPQPVESIPEQKPPVRFHAPLPHCSKNRIRCNNCNTCTYMCTCSNNSVNTSLVPRPLPTRGEGAGTHRLRMCKFICRFSVKLSIYMYYSLPRGNSTACSNRCQGT